ncbi:MAG: tetratricopeptide repeat protein [Candidatus Hodarchaeota archaeon]
MTGKIDILGRVKDIISEYHSIDNEGIGPWSEVSEVMEQEREANRYIQGIDISEIRREFAKAINTSKEPWRYIHYLLDHYRPEWKIQPSMFINNIVEDGEVKKSIQARIKDCIASFAETKDIVEILKTLFDLIPSARENEQVIEYIKDLWKKTPDIVDSSLVSHKIILEPNELEAITDIEKVAGRLECLPIDDMPEVESNVTYGQGSADRIKRGFFLEKGKIVGLGITYPKISKLPDNLGNLSNIRILCLNSLGLKTLPDSIGELTALEGLYLDYNRLATLPKTIGKCIKLKEIYIRSNLVKILPDEIGDLENLSKIMLNNNPLTSLPKTFKKLENLRKLYVQNTKLTADDIIPLKTLPKLSVSFALSCLADTLTNDKRIEEAVKAYIELHELDPDFSDFNRYNLGNLLNQLGRYDEAEFYLKNAKKFKKMKIESLISLGYSYYFQSKLDPAEDTFKEALKVAEKKSNKILLMINIGGLHLKQGRLEDAEEILLKAIGEDPKNGEVGYNLACLYSRKNDLDSCLKYLQLAFKYRAKLLAGLDDDEDFENVRSNDKFQELVASYKR